jgi:hypothetical protein
MHEAQWIWGKVKVILHIIFRTKSYTSGYDIFIFEKLIVFLQYRTLATAGIVRISVVVDKAILFQHMVNYFTAIASKRQLIPDLVVVRTIIPTMGASYFCRQRYISGREHDF